MSMQSTAAVLALTRVISTKKKKTARLYHSGVACWTSVFVVLADRGAVQPEAGAGLLIPAFVLKSSAHSIWKECCMAFVPGLETQRLVPSYLTVYDYLKKKEKRLAYFCPSMHHDRYFVFIIFCKKNVQSFWTKEKTHVTHVKNTSTY